MPLLALVLASCVQLVWSAQARQGDSAARLDRAHGVLMQAAATANPQLCRDLRAEFERDPPEDWSPIAFRVWIGLGGCEHQPGGAWMVAPPTADDIRREWALPLAHFSRMPLEQRLKSDRTVDLRIVYWGIFRGFHSPSLAAVGDAEEAAALDDWYARAAQTPPDPLAVASLTRLGPAVYGMRWRANWMAQQQQRLEATLGPGHPATLHMLRSRIFAARAHERPAEALAMSDDYAARLARHRPDDVLLAMLNRSERVGALAGVGRHADALDEGRLLLQWELARQPPDPGNVMRTAYNLASVAMDIGDHEAAEAFGRLSREQGLRSNSHDRGESIVGEYLRLAAAVRRGDDRAGRELKAVLQAILHWDLGGLDAVLALHEWARRTRDADTERWAFDLLARVTHDNSTSLHGARALPLVLQAEGAPAGSETGAHAAAAALAHGLAGDAGVAEVRPALELARHVAGRQPTGAAWLCKRAAQALVEWRQALPEQQAAGSREWLADHDLALRRCVALLIDLGRLGEAEQVMEVLREEELHEFRRRSRGPAAAPAARQAIGFTADERGRNAQVAPLQEHLRQEAAAARARADAQPDPRLRRGGLDGPAEAAVQQAVQALQQLSLQAGPRQAQAEVHKARPLPGQARITYALEPQGAAWALVDHGRQRRRIALPVGAAELARAVAELRAAIVRPGHGVPEASRRLHAWLIEPLQPWLQGARHLVVAPDGVLRYLPFAALHDGRRYLVERHELSLLLQPGLQAESPPAPVGPPQVVAFGRTLPSAEHSALPGVEAELDALRQLPRARVAVALNERFTRDGLNEALRGRPQVVHLASHFVLAPASEEDSYLLLGDGARMPLRELRSLPWQGVRLALLSSCDSALPLDHGGAAQGREWAGLAAALQRAGVPQVVATLWRIDDAGTARWMSGFYAQWARVGAAAPVDAALLARAQRAWLRQHRHGEWGHPRHWAGFVWIGPG